MSVLRDKPSIEGLDELEVRHAKKSGKGYGKGLRGRNQYYGISE